ncbi:hypothetical protein, partial [Pseudomonas syringae]|uniref:hypothetical protein n=1 Tax=Pseudomonas syringae TaxID=317 RepID=UPI003F66C069
LDADGDGRVTRDEFTVGTGAQFKALDKNGDGVVTDVMGANAQGLDCLFIAQGIHGDQAKGADGTLDPARAAELLKAETTYARYAALELAW